MKATPDLLIPTEQDKSAESVSKRSEGGFTLVEVMVVVLIIGILLAIGIPTFLGARARAQDRAAQTNLRSAQTTALIIFTDNADFKDATVTTLSQSEPTLDFVNGTDASKENSTISFATDGSGKFGAAVRSDSGACFFIYLNAEGATKYGTETTVDCIGNNALGVSQSGW